MHRVLLIDDTESLHRPIKNALVMDGIEVYDAYDGTTGIHQAKAVLPDLILLDIKMPGIDGYEVCQELIRDPETAKIPIIFVSGMGEAEDRVRGLDLGAADFISKPFNVEELRARVRTHLRNKAALDQETWRAVHDGLTGIWSRSYFDERFMSEIAMSQRHGTPLSLIMVDVDHFKEINDTHGHAVGDAVLRGLAELIDANRRLEDVACRYGGEEFVIICRGVRSWQARVLAERLRSRIALQLFTTPKGALRITCSFGVAGGCGSESMLSAADGALYRAKSGGRNCVVENVEEEVSNID